MADGDEVRRDGVGEPARSSGGGAPAVAALRDRTPARRPPAPAIPLHLAALLGGLQEADREAHRLRVAIGCPDTLMIAVRRADELRRLLGDSNIPAVQRELMRLDRISRERTHSLSAPAIAPQAVADHTSRPPQAATP